MYGTTIYAVSIFRNTRGQVDGSAGMRRSPFPLDSALVGCVQRVFLSLCPPLFMHASDASDAPEKGSWVPRLVRFLVLSAITTFCKCLYPR